MDGAAQDQRSAPLLSSDGLKVLESGDLHMSECLLIHTLYRTMLSSSKSLLG